jgi:hypothetical protein
MYVVNVLTALKHSRTSIDGLRAFHWVPIIDGSKAVAMQEAERCAALCVRVVVQRMPSATIIFDSEAVPVIRYDGEPFDCRKMIDDEEAIAERMRRRTKDSMR